MSLEILKTGFKNYLENQGKIEQNTEEAENVNLFEHAEDFKTYLDENLAEDSTEIKSKSVKDVLDMEFTKDGKIADVKETEEVPLFNITVDNNQISQLEIKDEEKEINTDEIENYNSEIGNDENKTENAEKSDMFTDVFNELLSEERFKNTIDTDGNGEIDDKEFEDFVNKIKGFDNTDENVSVDDLLIAAKQIKNNVFNVPKDEKSLTEKDIENIKLDMKDTKPVSADRIPYRSNVGGVPIPAGGYASGLNTYDSTISAKTPENMSNSEIKSELEKAQNVLTEKQQALYSIIDGSDFKIKSLQTAADNAYNTYKEKVKSVNAQATKKLDELKQKIDTKEKELNEKDKQIAEKEIAVSNAEVTYNNAKSSLENLEKISNELKTKGKNDNVSEVNSQFQSAQKSETESKQILETAKQELETLKGERSVIEKELNALNKQMTKLKSEIASKHPEVEKAQNDWENAKTELAAEKETAKTNAKSEVLTAQENVTRLNNSLTSYQNNELLTKYSNQYNEGAGNKIANAAQNVPGTTGRCLAGVADTLDAVYGAGTFPPINSAYQAADILASNEGIGAHFTEVQVAREDLPKLPAGAIVVWNNNANGGGSNVSEAGKVHGHISVALGNGQESSDHIQEQMVNRDATFRVFYPNS